MIASLECARLADGAAVIIIASSSFLEKRLSKDKLRKRVDIVGYGETSSGMSPPEVLSESFFTAPEAFNQAYKTAGMSPKDVQFFGLYDCFPIALIRAIEACGLTNKGEAGKYIEANYNKYMKTGKLETADFPVNTHGGLLGHGAPWEVPAAYNVIEAVHQIRGEATNRQVSNCKNAIAYGNGGIFSH
jgi:acetyl-CoA acetyltransferase